MNIQKIKVDELKLSNIVDEFSQGKIRIPRFQRNYVWDRPRVVKLLNSIYKEYPIGTFFFWEAPSTYIHLYRNIPDLNIPEPDPNRQFNFILDGQQRITSLYVAIKGLVLKIEDSRLNIRHIDYSEITFDLDREEFVIKKPDNERFVSLASILEEEHLALFKSLTDERAKAFDECYKRFNSYPLSVVYVRDQSLSEACEIFERINQGGVKLSIFDLVVASTWSNDFDLKEEVNKLNKQLAENGFGALPPETILQTVSLVVKGQATRPAELQLTKDDITLVWEEVSRALELSIDFAVANLGIKIIEFIPYISMIPMIAYLFVKNNNKALDSKKITFLEEWFWKSTFSERYTSSTASLMGEDRRDLFDPIIKGGEVSVAFPVVINEKDLQETKMYRYSAIRNGILCILAQMHPRHLKNGGQVELNRNNLSDYNSPERHHIFPRSYLKKHAHTSLENSIVNFCYIPAELNNEISDEAPSKYFTKFKKVNPHFNETLKTHLIPSEIISSIWSDDYNTFLSQRSELLLKEIEKRIGKISPLEDQLQREPEVVLSKMEENFRIIIDTNLTEKFGSEYWKKAIPGDIQESVKDRIQQSKLRYPDREIQSDLEKLSFCDVSDYRKIITKYWGLFEDEFHSLGDFERNFVFLSDYRNVIKHTRTPSSIEKKQGEAAIEWFIHNMRTEDTQEHEEE